MGKDKGKQDTYAAKSLKSTVRFRGNVEIFQVSDSWQVRMHRGSLKAENQQNSAQNYNKLKTRFKNAATANF